MARRVVRWLALAVVVIAYPLLAHYTNESAHNENLGALVAMAPLLLLAGVLAWRSPRRAVMLAILGLSCGALWAAWPMLTRHFGLVYWLQNVAMQLILFMTFGRTLLAGRQALCTRFAGMMHGPLTPRHESYARQVTIAWTLFFAVMALASTLLFFLAPLTVWSVFSNFLTLPLVALMFIAEYAVRWWLLPETRHTRILDAVRAYRNAPVPPR